MKMVYLTLQIRRLSLLISLKPKLLSGLIGVQGADPFLDGVPSL